MPPLPRPGEHHEQEISELKSKLEEMTRCRDSALRQLDREDTPITIDTYDLIHQGLNEVVDEWEGGDEFVERLVNAIMAKLHPEIAKLEEYRERAEAKIRELAKERRGLLYKISTTKRHYQRRTETLEAARDRNKKTLDDVVNEVFTITASHPTPDAQAPEYLYHYGLSEGLKQAHFAVLRGLGCFDPNHEVWIPMSRVEDVDLIRLAINDPGAFTKREKVHDGEYESLGQWGARAVLVALREGRGDR